MSDSDRALHADALMEEAVRLQNQGRWGEADAHLNEAERLLDEEDAELDAMGVPRILP